MGRAKGKGTSRKPCITPGSPEGLAIGLSDRQQGQGSPRIAGESSPIPGGRDHLANYPTQEQKVPIPVPRPEFRGVMAHGVEPEHHSAHERAEAMRGPNDHKPLKPHYAGSGPGQPVPVPVYVVAERGGPRPLRTATTRRVLVPALNADPIILCGKDFNRTTVRLMNDDATAIIRFSNDPTALVQDPATSGATVRTIGGAKLPAAMSAYQPIETQDEIWGIVQAATGTAEISIIMETTITGAGGQT